jgi:uncharacterized membrane protein
MSCASYLLLLLPLSFLSFAALADEKAHHPAAPEERRMQTPDTRRDAKHLEENRRLKHLWRQLSHEERNALRQQLHQAYRDRHPERQTDKRGEGHDDDTRRKERAQLRKTRRSAHEAYWQSLPPEERKALRDALREALRRQHEGATGIMIGALPETFPAESIGEKEKAVSLEAR